MLDAEFAAKNRLKLAMDMIAATRLNIAFFIVTTPFFKSITKSG
jgi:hypothetical protein